MRVLVCGSRHFNDEVLLDKVLSEVFDETCVLIDGMAKGADTLAFRWLYKKFPDLWQHMSDRYPAKWEEHGKAAGPIRNKQMIDYGKPDLVIAFLAPNSRGTANMISQAEKAGIPVKVIHVGTTVQN